MIKRNNDELEIDLLRLVDALWRRVWAIILVAAIFGGAMFAYTTIFVTPLYKARALMYVNSSDISVGGSKLSISQGELNAAQSLIKTYSVILKTRTTLNEVIEQAGLHYSYGQLNGMISASSVNNTEVFAIEVTSPDPQEAALIANTIAQVLPGKIASIVEGSSARIVDYAVAPSGKSSPDTRKNAMMGAALGALLACAVIIVLELLDDEIHDSDYLTKNYDLPVLAVIPDLNQRERNTNAYYRRPADEEEA